MTFEADLLSVRVQKTLGRSCLLRFLDQVQLLLLRQYTAQWCILSNSSDQLEFSVPFPPGSLRHRFQLAMFFLMSQTKNILLEVKK